MNRGETPMLRKMLIITAAAATIGGAVALSSTEASAQWGVRHWDGAHFGGWGWGGPGWGWQRPAWGWGGPGWGWRRPVWGWGGPDGPDAGAGLDGVALYGAD